MGKGVFFWLKKWEIFFVFQILPSVIFFWTNDFQRVQNVFKNAFGESLFDCVLLVLFTRWDRDEIWLRRDWDKTRLSCTEVKTNLFVCCCCCCIIFVFIAEWYYHKLFLYPICLKVAKDMVDSCQTLFKLVL